MKESDKIELRSEEVEEILTRPPHALIRYGTIVITGVLSILFIGCFFFKYPDIIQGEALITTENPPVWLVSKSSGKINELNCADKQQVKQGDILAVIDNTASTAHVESLYSLLKTVIISDSSVYIPHQIFLRSYELGDLQSAFSSFTKAAVNYDNFLSINLTNQEKLALQKQISGRTNYFSNLQKQLDLKDNELVIAKTSYQREKKLFEEGVISKSELETTEQAYLNLEQSLQELKTSIVSENLESVQMNESVKKLTLEYLQDKNQYYSELKSAYRELIASIEVWKQTYLLMSPIEGTVTFNSFWQKDQFIEIGNKVFAVISKRPGKIIGKITIKSSGYGKIKIGQTVNIKLNGYPYMEYGVLKSKIKNISLVPDKDDKYTIEVELTNGLTTTTKKTLEFSGELSGEAEIITDDRSLGMRLITPLKYILEDKIR